MTIHLIDVHFRMHTCPANKAAHPFDIIHTLLATIPGGPCQAPVAIRIGDLVTTTDCRLHVPTDRQCAACRPTTWIRHTTYTDHGHQHPTTPPAVVGLAVDSCPHCRTPVAATLRDGVHLLCPSPRRRS